MKRSGTPLRWVRLAATVVLTVSIALATATASLAADRVVRRGSCSGPSDWKLDVRRIDGGRLRVTLEVEGGRSGQEWHVFLSDNGTGFYAGSRTSGTGGYLEVQRRTTDLSGSDTIRGGANNLDTSETCSGKATL